MVNKKGFMRTLEMVIAIVITFLFVVFIIPESQPAQGQKKIEVFAQLEGSPMLRSCAAVGNVTCIEELIKPILPQTMEFVVLVGSDANKAFEDLPDKEVFVDSILLVENNQINIVKVYYWREG